MTRATPEARASMTHDEAWELIPWLVTGALPEAEAARARAHVADCADCTAEMAAQDGLRAVLAAPRARPDHDAVWAELERRMDGTKDARPPHWAAGLLDRVRRAPGLALGGGALAAMLALAVLLPSGRGPLDPGFVTLTDPAAVPEGAVELRLRPVPGADPVAVAAALQAVGATPGPEGDTDLVRAYIAPEARDAALAALRADPLFLVVAADPVPRP